MAVVSTDDAARRQQFIWLGPVNSPWPFEAPGRSWITGMILCPLLTVVAFAMSPRPVITAVAPGPMGWLLTAAGALLIGVSAGVWITRRVGRVVSATRPLGHHLAVLVMEASAPRETPARTHQSPSTDGVWLEDRGRRVRRIDPPVFIEE